MILWGGACAHRPFLRRGRGNVFLLRFHASRCGSGGKLPLEGCPQERGVKSIVLRITTITAAQSRPPETVQQETVQRAEVGEEHPHLPVRDLPATATKPSRRELLLLGGSVAASLRLPGLTAKEPAFSGGREMPRRRAGNVGGAAAPPGRKNAFRSGVRKTSSSQPDAPIGVEPWFLRSGENFITHCVGETGKKIKRDSENYFIFISIPLTADELGSNEEEVGYPTSRLESKFNRYSKKKKTRPDRAGAGECSRHDD